ncbi:putative tetratricopeptide-like helical domain superfamily [Dioscorea sansibarensis]
MIHGLRRYAATSHFPLDADALDLLLRRSATAHHAKQAHAQILLHHHNSSAFLSARLVAVYSRLSLLADAFSVFFSSRHPRPSLLWNSILRATLFHYLPAETLSLYKQMHSAAVLPDTFTFPLITKAASFSGNSNICRCIHGHAVAIGYECHLHVANELVAMYANMGRMDLAGYVFDGMPLRNVISWNVLISGFATNFDCENACDAFRLMESSGTEPSPVSWTSLLSAHARCQRHEEVLRLFDEMRASGSEATPESVAVTLSVCAYASNRALAKAKEIHCFAIKKGFQDYSFVRNSLVCAYGKLGNREDAEVLFFEAGTKDSVSWNALISGNATAGLCHDAHEVFVKMSRSEVRPDLVSWSAVIGAFASSGMADRSFELFRQMVRGGVMPNSVTLATLLSACAELSALQCGREIHAHAIRASMDVNILVANGLVHMYAKVGSFRYGCLVFEGMENKDLITWNSIIAGYGMHGLCDEALDTFNSMIRGGLEPDGITFVAILAACSHTGRVSEARKMFDRMVIEHKISPNMEHYACMVDVLGRAGLLQEAAELVQRMPMEPNACIWGALLNSCRIYSNMNISEDIVKKVIGTETSSTGNYMLMSNTYAVCGMWEAAAAVRVLTKAKGLKKSPGQSWIEVKNKVHVFIAGGSLSHGAEGVCAILEDLYQQMHCGNCVTEFWFVFQESANEEWMESAYEYA